MAFVGFKSDAAAAAALSYFNNSFVDTFKISVEVNGVRAYYDYPMQPFSYERKICKTSAEDSPLCHPLIWMVIMVREKPYAPPPLIRWLGAMGTRRPPPVPGADTQKVRIELPHCTTEGLKDK